MKLRGYFQLSHTPDRAIEQVSATGHNKPDIRETFQYLVRRFDKILRSFLESNSTQKSDHLFFHSTINFNIFTCLKIHGVMDCHYLIRINPVTIDHDISCQITHCNHPVSSLHSTPLYIIHLLVDILPTSVKFRGMYMDHQRFTRNFFRHNPGRIGQPVMRVDNIKILLCRYRPCHHGVTGNFFHQVCSVFTGKLELVTENDMLGMFARLDGILYRSFESFRVQIRNKIRTDLHKVYILPVFI